MAKSEQEESMAIEPLPSGWLIRDLGLVGRGGMSHVHKVRDETLGREVAVKVLRSGLGRETRATEYFVQEAQLTAQLDHPNIPPVYALAAEKRIHCFSMKLLQGATLEHALKRRPDLGADALFAALEVMVRICDAVAFAHSRGVLHCDLKPHNVMVGEHGQIYVVDWGFARRKGALLPAQEHANVALGTPAYMAPEQARADNAAIDERTDIFQLGGILYRILAGKAPFSAETADAALQRAGKSELVPLEQLASARSIPRRLAAICARAMARAPADRYQTVAELRTDLEDFIRGTSRLPEKLYRAGEAIVREGDVGDCAYIILDGHCQATKSAPGGTTGLRLMGPGEMFGETAVLTGSRRLATVTALVDTTVAVVDQTFLQEEMQRTPLIALAIRAVAERFLDLDGRTAALTLEQSRFKALELALHELAMNGRPVEAGSGRWVPWRSLESRIREVTGLSLEAVQERLRRAPGLRLDAAQDRLFLVERPAASSGA
jgi:eukaryotic-like serine/threonine-protein kinase